MIFPIRCHTCTKVIGNKWPKYEKLMREEKKTQSEILDELDLTRFCCRTMFITHVELIDKIFLFNRLEPQNYKLNGQNGQNGQQQLQQPQQPRLEVPLLPIEEDQNE